jgi:hypothetical protein
MLTMNTIKHGSKKLKKTIEDVQIAQASGLVESILWKFWHITKNNLHVQCNPHQNSSEINHRDWKINSEVYLEAQKILNSQGNSKQKEQHWRYYNSWLQTILQSNSNKNSMVLAQKQTWRPVEQNRRYEAM